MARLTPSEYKPHLGFRFQIIFSALPNIKFYGKATTLPASDNNPITLEYGNTQMKVKGKTKWNDITMTFYAYENMTYDELWKYLNDLHQDVEKGEDHYIDDYKKDITIQLLRPNDGVVAVWKLVGGFMASFNPGQLDWASEEVVQPEITIAYDYAKYIVQA